MLFILILVTFIGLLWSKISKVVFTDTQTYKEGRQCNIIHWPLYLWRKCRNIFFENIKLKKISAVCSLAANGHFDSFVTIAGHDIDKMWSSGIVRRASFYMAHLPVTSFIWFCCRRIACFHKIIILKSSVWAVHTSLD